MKKNIYGWITPNALIHSCWSSGVPIQIRIEDSAMYISNDCVFPFDWTVETLYNRHRSRPYNPNIAGAFLELDMLKPGEEEFKKYVRLVNNMVLAIQNILFIAKI